MADSSYQKQNSDKTDQETVNVKLIDNEDVDHTHSISVSLEAQNTLITDRSDILAEYIFTATPDRRMITVGTSGSVTIESFNGIEWVLTDTILSEFGGAIWTSNMHIRITPIGGAVFSITIKASEKQ